MWAIEYREDSYRGTIVSLVCDENAVDDRIKECVNKIRTRLQRNETDELTFSEERGDDHKVVLSAKYDRRVNPEIYTFTGKRLSKDDKHSSVSVEDVEELKAALSQQGFESEVSALKDDTTMKELWPLLFLQFGDEDDNWRLKVQKALHTLSQRV